MTKHEAEHTEDLQLDAQNPLPYAYPADFHGAVARIGDGQYSAIETGLLAAAFGDPTGFVAFAPHPEAEARGVYPGFVISQWDSRFDPYFDRSGPDTVHFIDAGQEAEPFQDRTGFTDPRAGHHQLMVFELTTGGQVWRPELLVHECGHLFGMGDRVAHPPGFPAHPVHNCWDNVHGCIMLCEQGNPNPPNNDWTDGVAQFGGPTTPGVEPADLKDHVAGHPDPK